MEDFLSFDLGDTSELCYYVFGCLWMAINRRQPIMFVIFLSNKIVSVLLRDKTCLSPSYLYAGSRTLHLS